MRGYHSRIGENAAATETENTIWLSHGWEADSLVQRPVVRLWI